MLALFSCAAPPRKPPMAPGIPPTQKPYVIKGKTYYPLPHAIGYREVGNASWYGKGFHGRPTASGEIYDMYKFTAAHKTLPIGTYCLVENLENGRRTIVRINDRGPFVKNRIIDLSFAAARAIGMIGPGVARVRVTALGEARSRPTRGAVVFKHLPDLMHGRFYVQVGAFKDRANAMRLRKKLVKEYGNVVVRRRWTPRGIFHGVQVFAGTYLGDAKRLEARLERRGYGDSFIVSD